MIPRKHKVFFWLVMAAYSTFFAEVFAGSDLFPFFHPLGILFVMPLYGLHLLILTTLVFRFGKPRLSVLLFAGMLFGLYEAYITKVLWSPAWEAIFSPGNVAILEVFVLVFWWHTWFAFLTPLVLGESLLTTSRFVLSNFPPKLRRFYGSWKGWLGIFLFGAIFQAFNSPSPIQSLLSGLSTIPVLALLTYGWLRISKDKAYTLPDLLPVESEFRFLAGWLGIIYLFPGFLLLPERIPPVFPGQAIIWGMYAVIIFVLIRLLKRSGRLATEPPQEIRFPAPKTLLRIGIVFIVVLPAAKFLLDGFGWVVLTLGWLSGALFSVGMILWSLSIDRQAQ